MRYVSDYLIAYLDAEGVAAQIAAYWTDILRELPLSVRDLMASEIEWGSRKCMVLPPVWLFAAARAQFASLSTDLAGAKGVWVAIGLSTSVVDDLVDSGGGNERRVALFYLLLAASVARTKEDRKTALTGLASVVPAFVPPDHGCPMDTEGVRIGFFHRMIMEELCKSTQLSENHQRRLRDAALEFGAWCALLDDILDAVDDFSSSALRTRPLEIIERAIGSGDVSEDGVVRELKAASNRKIRKVLALLEPLPGGDYLRAALGKSDELIDDLVRCSGIMNLIKL